MSLRIFKKLTRKVGTPRRSPAASVLNNGTIENLPDRYVVEFTQIFEQGKMRPTRRHALPDVLFPWIAAFGVPIKPCSATRLLRIARKSWSRH